MTLDFDSITPLRLAQGSHEAGSGRGCAMNVLSFITGESTITDFPECSAQPLARMVQFVNDMLANVNIPPSQVHVDFAVKYLSPEDSVLALDLAWSTVGTAVTDSDTEAVWVARVLSNAEAVVQHIDPPSEHAWVMLTFAREHANRGDDVVEFARCAANAVFIAADIDALVLFVEDAIKLWKELNDTVEVVADPVVVNAAIAKMVSV